MSRFPLPLTLVLIAACDDTSPTPTSGLTDAEIRAIVPLLVTPGLTTLSDMDPGQRVERIPVSMEVDRTVVCPLGGTVTMTGAVSGEVSQTGDGTLDLEMLNQFDLCSGDVNGETFSVTSDEPLHLTGDIRVTGAQPDDVQTLALLGIIEIAEPSGTTHTCDVSLDLALTLSTRLAQVSGTLCNRAVTETISWAEDG